LGGLLGLLYSPLKSAFDMASKFVSKIMDIGGAGAGASQSMASLGMTAAKITAGLAAEVAVLIGFVYLLSQATSSTAEWARVEEQRNLQVKAFESTTAGLNGKLEDQKKIRDDLNAKGQSTVQINRDIADTEIAIASNVKASADAQERYNKAKAVQSGLETLSDTRGGTADTTRADLVKGYVSPELQETVGDPTYNVAERKKAELGIRIDAPKLRAAGTMKRIVEGDDNYSKFWKENQEELVEYNKQYDEFIYSNTMFNQAMEEGNVGNIIWFGIDSAIQQADIGLIEMRASFWSWIKDMQDGWNSWTAYVGGAWDNTVKWFTDGGAYIQGAWDNTVKWLSDGWNFFTSSIAGFPAWIAGLAGPITSAWQGVIDYFNDPTTIGGGVYDALKKIYCMIMGCSPGIIPALQELWHNAEFVFNKIRAVVEPFLTPLRDFVGLILQVTGAGGGGGFELKLPEFKLPEFNLPNFNLPDFKLPNLKIPQLKWPNVSQIINQIKSKIPKLNWKLPNIGQIIQNFREKIPSLHWNIPNVGQILSQTWQKIQQLFWQIPNIPSLLNQTWQKITQLIWQVPGLQDILNTIASRIPGFVWPMGPATRNVMNRGMDIANRGASVIASYGNPRGPIKDKIASTMSAKSGVGQGYIAQAMENRFNGNAGFTPIANGMSDHLGYQFYFGDQKSNQAVWDSGLCNCYDGAQFLVSEASQRFGLSAGMQNGFWGDIAHTWSVIGGQPFDMAAKLIRGTWMPPGGPLTDFNQFMMEVGPGLEYLEYGGHLKDPMDSVFTGGNCFDMSLGLIGMANNMFGLPGELVWGQYDGMSHVWARIAGRDYDPVRKSLANTYSPPPQGPLTQSNGGDTFIFQYNGTVYGVDDLDARTQSMVQSALEKREQRRQKYKMGG
jgi:hypothetical protein